MAVYVKPRGRFGRPYMTLIAPFRHWVLYPALLRQIERAWNTRSPRWRLDDQVTTPVSPGRRVSGQAG
jgi:hypothetical protein